MKKLLTLLLAIYCLSLPALASAAHPLATDDTGTLGKMKFQVETSAEFGWDRESINGVATNADSQDLNASITAGILEPLDLVVAFPFTWLQVTADGAKIYDNGGLNDLSMAIKWRFLEIGPVSFAVRPSITFPTGDYNRGLGAGRPAYGVTLISTVEFKPVAVHANVGFAHQKYTDADREWSRENLWNLSLAGTVEVMKNLQVVAEIGATTNGESGSATWPTFMTGGAIYSVIENLDISLGVKGGLTKPEPDIALLTGVTFKFP